MIRITVVSYNNLAPVTPISALFGAEQGTIGRSEDNFLVLPDPKHCVSRSQAKVRSNGTRHQLTNISLANPILINDQEIEAECEVDIHAGDQIRIGSYLLSVIAVEPSDFGQSNDLATTVSHVSQHIKQQIPQHIKQQIPQQISKPVIVPVTTQATTQAIERRAKISTPPSPLATKNKTIIQPPQFLLRKDGTPGYIQDMFPAAEPAERRMQPPSPITITAHPQVQQASAVQPPLFSSPALELPASSNELLQAFLKGAGLPDLNLSSGLTPELMETMGKLVATSVKGTMDLISQRALVKREANAEVTMVVLRKNNPLKFFPDSQTVLTQMLRK
ncbi:MAG: type VI secretion system-associated FHA domain protein TagH, partial [Pseudomonadota bacterium]